MEIKVNNSIEDICKKYDIKNYTINNDSSIDVYGYVYLYNKNLTEIPLNFNIVTGFFSCLNNPNLKSLKGAPKHCKIFYCRKTAIVSLEHAPEIVNEWFNCSSNPNLKSLKGAPKECLDFYCRNNPLIKTFEGLENTICEYYNFGGSPINILYSLFFNPNRIKEFIDLEITDGEIVKQYRLEHFLDKKLTLEEITDIEIDYYLL